MPKSVSSSLRLLLQKMGPEKLMKRDFTRDSLRNAADQIAHEVKTGRGWGTQTRPDMNLNAKAPGSTPKAKGKKGSQFA